MQTPALTWRVRRIGLGLWSTVCARREASWLSKRVAHATRRATAAPLAQPRAVANHWLAALRAQSAL